MGEFGPSVRVFPENSELRSDEDHRPTVNAAGSDEPVRPGAAAGST
jgi:hypothetical protein